MDMARLSIISLLTHISDKKRSATLDGYEGVCHSERSGAEPRNLLSLTATDPSSANPACRQAGGGSG